MRKDTKKEKISIFYITCDWNNLFMNDRGKFIDKIKRDRAGYGSNDFSYFAWSSENYATSTDGISVWYRKPLFRSQPFLHLVSIFVVPLILFRNKLKFDAVIVSDPGFLLSGYVASLVAGAKLISYMPHMPSISTRARAFGSMRELYVKTVERLFYPLVDFFLAINGAVFSYLVDKRVKRNKIQILTLDIFDRDMSHIASARKGVIRTKLGLSDKKIILCTARFEKEKNHLELIRLFSTLDSKFSLVLIGEGSTMPECKEYVKKLSIEDRVIFVGFIGREDIWNYYADADVFILLSKAEALGLVFWEAMYMKVPVIGSSAPGILETIGSADDRGIVLHDPISIDAFKNSVEKSLIISDEQRRKIEEAKNYVLKKIEDRRDFLQIYNDFFCL